MNDIDEARLQVRVALIRLMEVIHDSMPGDVDKEESRTQAEYTMDMIVNAEMVMVQNKLV